MFRKPPAVIRAWLEHGKDFYCGVQQKLLCDAAEMLKPGGTLDVRMNVRRGILRGIRFYGDFMSTAPLDDLTEALRGVPRERKALEEVLSHYDIPALFGTITEEEVLRSILE